MENTKLISQKQLNSLNHDLIATDRRSYLGLSGVGHPCARKLQYDLYFAYKKTISKRIKRLLNTGHTAEKIIIEDLETLGIQIINEQKEVPGAHPMWIGHIDGIGCYIHDKFLVEFKTHNDKSYNDLCKNGVKASKPEHYDQIQAYLGGLYYDYGLYIAINKNTSEYYFEYINFDHDRFESLKEKQLEVVNSPVLLPRIGNNKRNWYQCKFCDAKKVCFQDEEIDKTCRSCQHAAINGSGWKCTKHNYQPLIMNRQLAACPDYELDEKFL